MNGPCSLSNWAPVKPFNKYGQGWHKRDDTDLLQQVAEAVKYLYCPVGGETEHFHEALTIGKADAVLVLHSTLAK